jgi:hypothetical protein
LTNWYFVCYNAIMQKLLIQAIRRLFILGAVLCVTTTASAQQYATDEGMQYVSATGGNCGIAQSYWRNDEQMSDQYGTYSDPYSYGSLSSSVEYPAQTDYVDYGTQVSDNGYGNSMYDGGAVSSGSGSNVDQIASANLARAMQGRSQQVQAGTGVSGSGTGGGAVTGTAVRGSVAGGPNCTVIPRATGANSVVLEWQTLNATSAFIDNGIGHVMLGSGTRMVTPKVTTTYNMTVVDARGIANQCAAIVHVTGSPEIRTNGTMIDSGATGTAASTTQAAGNGTGGTTAPADGSLVDSGSNGTTQVGTEAAKIGTNVSDKVTSVLSSGQGIWNKMRQMSLVAIGLFFIIFIIIFVMRKMFGGGDEAHH